MISFPSSRISKRILVVEDEKPMRDILEITFGNGGAICSTLSFQKDSNCLSFETV